MKLIKSLCTPHNFIAVHTVLISKPTKYFTVSGRLSMGLLLFFMRNLRGDNIAQWTKIKLFISKLLEPFFFDGS